MSILYSLDKLEEGLLTLLENSDFYSDWKLYLKKVRDHKPRYYRDQLSVLKQLVCEHDIEPLDEAVIYCSTNELYSMNDIRNACNYMNQYNLDMYDSMGIVADYKPVCNPQVMDVITQKRDLNEYDLIGGERDE